MSEGKAADGVAYLLAHTTRNKFKKVERNRAVNNKTSRRTHFRPYLLEFSITHKLFTAMKNKCVIHKASTRKSSAAADVIGYNLLLPTEQVHSYRFAGKSQLSEI